MLQHLQRLSVVALLSAAALTRADCALADAPGAAAGPQPDVVAQTELAVRFEHAEGVPKDIARAIQLYCGAARAGYPDAQFRLGWLYFNGREVPRDDAVAAALFEMAANAGHEQAARLLRFANKDAQANLPACLFPDPPPVIAYDNAVPAVEAATQEPPQPLGEIARLVHQVAPRYAVDPKLALAVIAVESNFNPAAVSPKNAQGLMQLIPDTAERFGVKRILNPVENLNGGLAYLRWLLAFFQGDVALVAAAYNAGERAVERYRGVPPYPETRRYVKMITAMYPKAKHPYESTIVEPSPLVARAAHRPPR